MIRSLISALVRALRDIAQWPYKSLLRLFRRFTFAYKERSMATNYLTTFREDPKFRLAYLRGIKSLGVDYGLHFRIHQAIWAAETARYVRGDFVEMGVGTGFTMSAVMEYVDWWASSGKQLWLVDTFAPNLVTRNQDQSKSPIIRRDAYAYSMEETRENFRNYENVRFIKGFIPDCLDQLEADAISFIHIDLNHAEAELNGLRSVWNKLSIGGVILLDDYGFPNRLDQHDGMNQLAGELDFSILTLATGQGIAIKRS